MSGLVGMQGELVRRREGKTREEGELLEDHYHLLRDYVVNVENR